LNADDDPTRVFSKNHPYNAGLREFREAKGWQNVAYLYADAPLGSPPALDALDPIAETLVHSPALAGNVVGYETAARSLAWLKAFRIVPEPTLDYEYKRSLRYKQFVDERGFPRAALFIKSISVHDLQALKAEVARLCPRGECHAGGELIAYSDFATRVPKTLVDSMGLSMLLVGAVIAYLAFAFGKQAILAHLLASAFWGACFMIVLMVGLRIPMDFLKCIVASVLIGLTGDNAIQYLFAAGSADLSTGVRSRGEASIQTNLFMAITSLMYLFSYFNPPRLFGLLLALGFVAALIGDLWILNGLLPRKTRHAS
jgi:hypothetical protein